MVLFECSIGVALALWRGKTTPQTGSSLDVEIDINILLGIGRSAIYDNSCVNSMSHNGLINNIIAPVESVDGDGMIFLRISPDCMVMAESIGAIKPGAWLSISVMPHKISITPQGA